MIQIDLDPELLALGLRLTQGMLTEDEFAKFDHFRQSFILGAASGVIAQKDPMLVFRLFDGLLREPKQ